MSILQPAFPLPRMASTAPQISLVIPAYNEARRLPANLARVAEYCAGLDPGACGLMASPGDLAAAGGGGRGWEVLVIVERSTDDTLAQTRATAAGLPGIEVIDNLVQRGKGYAVRSGMLRARGQIVLFMDADLSTPLFEVEKFLRYFAAHPAADVLIGNRRHPGSRIGRAQGRWRQMVSEIFSVLVRRQILPGAWRDTQCGFKAFRAEAAREIFSRQQIDGFSFDVEVLALAAALDFEVVDLPVEWFDADASTVRLFSDGWRMLRDLWRVRKLAASAAADAAGRGK